MTKFLVNPFFVYILSFVFVSIVYCLGWSGLYPSITLSVGIFFFITFIISLLLGLMVHRLKRIDYHPIPVNDNRIFLTVMIWAGYCAEFIYNKGIPLLLVIRSEGKYEYRLFGIPSFHVFLATLNSFLAVYFFHQLISRFSKTGLAIFILNIVPSLLIMNRGMLIMILTSCFFVYLSSLKKIRLTGVITLVILVLVIFYLFGLLGNLRQTGKWNSDYIIEHSHATTQFKKSFIPKEFIWAYLYISSPLANFQTTVDNGTRGNSLAAFLNYEILPDFISKRTAKLGNLKRDKIPRITGWLNVSTFYAGPYVALGWLGVIFMFGFFILTTVTYTFLLRKKSEFYVTGLALLNTLVLYCTFDNMYAFSGLCLQLIYPLFFSYVRIFPSSPEDV